MKLLLSSFTLGLILIGGFAAHRTAAQIVDTPDAVIANIPVNYTEAKVGLYTLPDPLVLNIGDRVTDAKTWFEKRRPEILELLLDNEYGRAPGPPEHLSFEVTDPGTVRFNGQARRKQITIYFTEDHSDHYVDLLVYLPAGADSRVPLLLQLGSSANNIAVEDEGVKVGRTWDAKTQTRSPATNGRRFGAPHIMDLIERGYGIAIFNYNDIDPDALNSIDGGIRALYLQDGKRADDDWGSISAWAWGVSRVMDYFETDPDVDATRIAITGVSRLGKTALWAGATDQRIAAVIASVSGEGGAALSRRNYGETVAHLMAPTRYPYWFAPNYAKWAHRMPQAPFDAHFIISLVAPRPLLLQTGYTDTWSDPYGEFLAAKAATPVYELLGAKGIEQYSQPSLGEATPNTLGFLMHDGGHGTVPADWPVFLDFLDKYL